MTLKQAAAIFNTQVFTDINGGNAFLAQVTPFTDVTRSSEVSHRRIMETAPEINAPEVVIQDSSGEEYIVSTPVSDVFRGSAIRKKYVINPVRTSYSISGQLGILSSIDPSIKKGSQHYVKRIILVDRSELQGGYSLVFPSSVNNYAGDFIWEGSSYFLALEDSYIDDIGFSVTSCMKIATPFKSLTVNNKSVYNPVTETHTVTTTDNVECIIVPREKAFINLREDSENNADGDVTIATLHSCSVGDTVGDYMVVLRQLQGSINVLHCRLS